MKRIALTAGEPSGIGPDLIVQLATKKLTERVAAEIIVIADEELLQRRAQQLNLPFSFSRYDRNAKRSTTLKIVQVSAENNNCCGTPDKANVPYILETLEVAAKGCMSGEFDALVTGPIHKAIINEAGISFSGHTEFFADLTKVNKTVMLLQTDGLRVALATTHLPLNEVSKAITTESLSKVITILHRDLQHRFNINNPKIYVCGLNPHAGENGYLGREEIDVITPVLQSLQQSKGMKLVGPLPADTLFTANYLQDADCVLAMYHDQGLPVLKYKGFGKAANITLGLPFIRTSVDHGTALDIAGTGKAEISSLEYALQLGITLK